VHQFKLRHYRELTWTIDEEYKAINSGALLRKLCATSVKRVATILTRSPLVPRRFVPALGFPERLRKSTISTTDSTPDRQRRNWVIPACAAVLACAAVVFAAVGFSGFRSKATQVQLVNDTGALALLAQEDIDGRTRLHFKNVSAKDLNGFVLGLPNLRQVEIDTTTGDRVIVPGEVQDIEIPGPLPTVTILAVMYADGSLEGDPITVAELRDRRSALKAELKRILGLVLAEAQSRNGDMPGAFDRLEAAISKLPATVGDGETRQANALRVAKEDLARILDVMRYRQERNAHLNQRELIRQLKERIERRIASL
jgi:hypothetical protein